MIDLHPTKQLKLINNDHSFIYVYQWLSSNPEVATVDENGLVTAQGTGSATITALASNGQAVRCTVIVTSDIGRVTLNKNDLLFKTVGSKDDSDGLCGIGKRRERPHHLGEL